MLALARAEPIGGLYVTMHLAILVDRIVQLVKSQIAIYRSQAGSRFTVGWVFFWYGL